jgi:acyl-CoA thioesterase II
LRPVQPETLVRRPCPFRARAWWGDQLVAESTGAVRVEEAGRPPALYFPRSDVRFDQLDQLDQLELGSLEGLVAFDHEKVRVEVVDGAGAGAHGDPRDVTVKRFPTWGDASDLIEVLDVRPAGERAYVSVARDDGRRPVVEGSQMLGQALVAAGRHAPGRRAVSAHMVFARAADARRPLRFDLDEQSAGRTFTTLTVHVSQDERRCATGTLLLDATAPDVVRHTADPPDVPGPYDCEPYDMAVTGRDIRVVGGAYTDDPDAPAGPPTLDAWVRFREVPADEYLHAGLLAQFTGHMSIAAALRPHEGVGQAAAHRTLSTAINAIALSLHGPVRADRWMLYHHLSTFAGDGMTHSECRVHDEAGALLASFSVDAMVRGFAGHTRKDERTAL